jgi:hypothetical protein
MSSADDDLVIRSPASRPIRDGTEGQHVRAPSVLPSGATSSEVVYEFLWALLRHLTLAANCVRWEQGWQAVAPQWTRDTGIGD